MADESVTGSSEELPLARAALALALVAVIVGRGLGQALPGSLTGIDRVISVVETAAAVVTQLCAALLTAGAMRTLLVVLFTQRTQLSLKVLSAATTSLVAVSALFAALLAQNQLAVTWSAASAMAVATTLVLSAGALFRRKAASGSLEAGLRGAGLVASGVAVASLAHTLSRVLALFFAERASLPGFAVARGFATLGFALELAALVVTWIWLLRPETQRVRTLSAVAAVVALGLAIWSRADHGWGFVLQRALDHLSAHPDPWVPEALRHALELFALSTVVGCLLSRRRPVVLLMALGLCVLGRSSADVPLGAVFLINAALALQLGANKSERRLAQVIGISEHRR